MIKKRWGGKKRTNSKQDFGWQQDWNTLKVVELFAKDKQAISGVNVDNE